MKKALKAIGMALLYLLLYLALQVGVTIFGTVIFSVIAAIRAGVTLWQGGLPDPQIIMEQIMAGASGLVLLSNGTFVLVVVLMFRCENKRLLQAVKLQSIAPGNLIACLLVGVSMPFVLSAFLSFLPFPEELLEEFSQQQGLLFAGNPVIGFLSIVIGAPVAEELLFRGLIYNRMKTGLRPWLAGILSALLFGLCHGQSFWILAAFLMGLLMAWCYEKTGSLWGSIAIHGVNNGIAFFENYLPAPDGLATLLITLACNVILLSTLTYLFLANRKIPEES